MPVSEAERWLYQPEWLLIASRFRGILKATQDFGGLLTGMGLLRTGRRSAWILRITSQLVVLTLAAGNTLPQEPAAKGPAPAKALSKASKKKSPDTFTLVGAGDIAGCSDLSGAEATAKLIDAIPGTVFAAGDLVYQRGTYE